MLSRKLFIQSETCRVVAHETGSGDSKDSRTAPYQTQDPYHPTRHPYHSPRYNGTATTRTVSPKGFDHLIFGKTQANIGDTFQETDMTYFFNLGCSFCKMHVVGVKFLSSSFSAKVSGCAFGRMWVK